MPDEMFFSPDMRSLRRGKRRATRTPVCRPCLVWPKDTPGPELQGVALDVSPFGMRIRMMDYLPAGVEVRIQLMRDEDFQEPLAAPLEGRIVRAITDADGFTDHGVALTQKDIRRHESRPVTFERRRPRREPRARMHTLDITVGGRQRRRTR